MEDAEAKKRVDNALNASMRGPDCLAAFSGKRAAISFTGGKDCHLAMQRAVEAGIKIVCAVAFQSNGHSPESHRIEWQKIQCGAMGIPLCTCPLNFEKLQGEETVDYKEVYAAAVRDVYAQHQIDLILTGDIDYVGSSTTNFKQEMCRAKDVCGVKALLPLWQEKRKDLLQEMVGHNMDVRMGCVKSPHFDESWVGRRIDGATVAKLEEKTKEGLDLTGENGEYHTMVIGGPMYKTQLQFTGVVPKELHDVWRRNSEERCWVIRETAQLVPLEKAV